MSEIKELSVKAREISVDELKEVLELSHKAYTTESIDPRYPNLYLASCYTQAVLSMLSKQGYSLIKKAGGASE